MGMPSAVLFLNNESQWVLGRYLCDGVLDEYIEIYALNHRRESLSCPATAGSDRLDC